MKKLIHVFAALFIANILYAQQTNLRQTDTLTPKEFLPDVTVVGKDTRHDIVQTPEIIGTHIFAGKKNALIIVNNVNGNIVNNTMRQVLAKVPGIHIWESDGSGIQVDVATRGLSPNRSWDFNVRQNGYDISADPFGYPEAYYNPPMQAVQRIQVIKGAGSLQFGPQLGGMLNYVLHNGSEIHKSFSFETRNTAGSFGMINTFNAVGGQNGKSNYYAFFDHRNGDGWRDNSRYKTNTGFATYGYKFNDKWKAGIEVLHYEMLSQQPGGLADSLFNIDGQQSLRSRNWMNIAWITAAATIDFKSNENNIFNLKIFGLKGDRNSIGFLLPINIKDSINANTKEHANRAVDVDQYKNFGAELCYLKNYKTGNLVKSLSTSVRYFHGNTNRFRNGKGDTGSDFNTNITGNYIADLNFETNNIAIAAENIFRVSKAFIIIPGVRWESVGTTAQGRVNYNSDGSQNNLAPGTRRSRNFLLAGLAAEYHIGNTEFYSNVT